MSLQFILGNSGSGKSYTLYQKIIEESIKHRSVNYIVIVPEQFTMQTQKDLVMQHPDRGIMNIDVLSFRRLAHRIFEEVGADRRTVLTETGKNLMLRKVAIEQQDRLQILGGHMNRPGYVSEVKSALSELMQYEITDEDMEKLMEYTKKRPLLHTKLSDLRILYQAFLDYQKDRFMKPEELMDVLCQMADRSELLKNSILAFDGFTGFTPSQLNVLQKLLRLCPKIYITVTFDVRDSVFGEILEHELFALSKKTIRSVLEAAQGNCRKNEPSLGHVEIEPPILPGRDCLPRFKEGGELWFLERNLFRGKQAFRRKRDEERTEISLHASPSPADEVHFAARCISRLVREQGYRYQDIAVITGKLDAYDHYVKKIFPMYEVPVFVDQTRHILLNPCLEFVRGALEVLQKDFSAETVFRFLRTGMAGVSQEELDVLENYVLATGVRGRKKWSAEWTCLPAGRKTEELEQCNLYRSWAMEHLLPFAEKMKQRDNTIRMQADALCELMENCCVQQFLKDREISLLQRGDRETAREYSQIYRLLIHLLEEMVELLGEEKVTIREFGEILDAGFSEASVGIIPPGIDQVQVGDITRSRLNHVKVLFFLGLNDGWVPSAETGGGIVSDMEREILQESGIELAPSVRENSYIQRFYLYQNLTKPQDRLYLSWCSSGGDGTAMRPSYLTGVIRRMYPYLRINQEKETGTDLSQITTKENGMLYFTKGLQKLRNREPEPEWTELYSMYIKDESYRDRIRSLVKAAFIRGTKGRLSFHTSRELYGETMSNSVTRLEQFASCAFAHFAAYGLQIGERELYGVKPSDLGIIFHRAMELFSRRLQSEGYEWDRIPEEVQTGLMEACVDEVTGEYGFGIFQGSARDACTVRRIKRILCRTVWALHQQIRAGSFRPAGFEVSFETDSDLESVNVRFGEEGNLHLMGKVDRIDTAETEDSVYVKIVDYKSGRAKFDPVAVYYGLQLQLVVYLNAALEMEQKRHPEKAVIPAGIFYYHLEDPLLEKEAELTFEESRKKLLKTLRPDGVFNKDDTIVRMLDAQMEGESLVIPAGLKKDGSLSAKSSAVTGEQLLQLSGFVTGKMAKMADQIMQGEVTPEPYADQEHCACEYCAYADVCGFDRKIPGMCEKRVPALKKEDVWELIAREQEESDDR